MQQMNLPNKDFNNKWLYQYLIKTKPDCMGISCVSQVLIHSIIEMCLGLGKKKNPIQFTSTIQKIES